MKKTKRYIPIIIVMIGIIIFVWFFSSRLVAPTDQQAAVVTPQELRQAGLFDVTAAEFGADKTGVEDSTDEIQEAMDAAYNSGGVTYFPPGSYRISRTLVALRDRDGGKNYQLIGSKAGEQLPTLILTSNSFNDDNASNNSVYENFKKKAMLHVWGCSSNPELPEGKDCDPEYGIQKANPNGNDAAGAAAHFGAVVRNLKFVIENDNPDSIGLRVVGNQRNEVSNIIIEAGDAFAGYYGTIGTNAVVQDMEVYGGKYGIYNGYGGWGSYSNIVLKDQQILAFTSPMGPPVSLSGFEIVKDTAPAVGEVPGLGYATSRTYHQGSFSLNDGSIEFRNASTSNAAISTVGDRQIAVVNVFVKNSPKLIEAGNTKYDGNATGWSKINIYANTMVEDNAGFSLVEGVEMIGEDYVVPNTFVTSNVVAPTAQSLRMNHGVADSTIPSPDMLLSLGKEPGSGVVSVVNEGITPINNITTSSPDYANELNEIINRPGVHTIFFPKGEFPVGSTITLKANTKLIGLSPALTKLETHPNWRPGPITDMVNTVDNPDGETVIAHISLITDRGMNNNKFNNLHWMVGKKSIIYHVNKGGKNDTGCDSNGWGGRTYWTWFSHNGGGRMWNSAAHSSNCSRYSAEHRGIFVNGTNQPLIMYGLNPEDGHGNEENDREGYMIEINNARNVSLRSDKSEQDNALLVRNSQNIFILNLGGTVETALRDNSDMLVMNSVAKFKTFGNGENRKTKDLIEEEINGNLIKKYKTDVAVSVLKRGNIDLSVWELGSDYVPDPPISNTPSLIESPTPTPTMNLQQTSTPLPSHSVTPSPTRNPTSSPTPTSTPVVQNTPTPTLIAGSICGRADSDNNGAFDIADFVTFAAAYQDGNRTCDDTAVNYGACGGRDVDRDGRLNIADFGGTNGFASRYYPKTSCAL